MTIYVLQGLRIAGLCHWLRRSNRDSPLQQAPGHPNLTGMHALPLKGFWNNFAAVVSGNIRKMIPSLYAARGASDWQYQVCCVGNELFESVTAGDRPI